MTGAPEAVLSWLTLNSNIESMTYEPDSRATIRSSIADNDRSIVVNHFEPGIAREAIQQRRRIVRVEHAAHAA